MLYDDEKDFSRIKIKNDYIRESSSEELTK